MVIVCRCYRLFFEFDASAASVCMFVLFAWSFLGVIMSLGCRDARKIDQINNNPTYSQGQSPSFPHFFFLLNFPNVLSRTFPPKMLLSMLARRPSQANFPVLSTLPWLSSIVTVVHFSSPFVFLEFSWRICLFLEFVASADCLHFCYSFDYFSRMSYVASLARLALNEIN